MAGQLGCAKCLITRPAVVPTKPHGCPRQLPFPRCLEQGVSCNYCLTILPLDPSLQTGEASLPRNHTSLQALLASALPWLSE